MLLGIVLFVVLIILSILLHEGGHLVFAKRFGMKATEYFCGFGPRVFSFRRGETEYGLKAIPAGGYVKILGMSPAEELDPADEPRAFWRQRTWKKAIVIGAGSATHALIAFALLWVAASGFGSAEPGTSVENVLPCLEEECTPGSIPSPAAEAGIRAGDEIVTIGTTRIENWVEDSATALEGATGTVPVTVLRNGAELTLPVEVAPPLEGDRARLGFAVTLEPVRAGVLEGAGLATEQMGAFVVGSFQGLASLPQGIADTAEATFTERPRDMDDPVGLVGVARISGEISSLEQIPTGARISLVLVVVAAANIFFGIFNLLPIPPLDGGHLLVMGLESIRRRYASWRSRPDPGPIAPERLMPVTLVVVVMFIGLTLLLLIADIVDPIRLTG